MLDLDAKSVKQVKFNGQVYEIRPLKVRDQKAMSEELRGKDQESTEYFDAVLKHIGKCGVPAEVLEEMDGDQLRLFIEFLGEKKS